MQQLLLNSREDADQLLKIIKTIHMANIDFRVLNNLRILYLNRDETESGQLPLNKFENLFVEVTKNSWPLECKQLMFSYITSTTESGQSSASKDQYENGN